MGKQLTTLGLPAELGGRQMLGQYALAAAMTAAASMLAHLYLSAILAEDVEGPPRCSDYLQVRFGVPALALAAMVGLAFEVPGSGGDRGGDPPGGSGSDERSADRCQFGAMRRFDTSSTEFVSGPALPPFRATPSAYRPPLAIY